VFRPHPLRLGFFFLLAFGLAISSCSSPRRPAFAITHVTLIDVTDGGTPLRDSTVVVSGNRISVVGPSSSVSIPRGAKVLDATGKVLIPGLADMHLHLTGAGEPTGSREFFLPLLVANGITTVRDMGGKIEYLKELREEIDSGKRLGPQIFFTGPYLDGDPPGYQPAIVVRNASDAHQAVTELKQQGVDFIKVQSRLSREAYFAIAKESQAQQMRFVGHVPDTVSALEAGKAGQSSIEHLTGVLLATSSREEELRRRQIAPGPANESSDAALERSRQWQRDLLQSLSPQKSAVLLSALAKNHVVQVPTFPVLVHLGFLNPDTDLSGDAHSKYLSSALRKIWEQGRKERLDYRTEADFALRREIIQRLLEVVGKMNAAGITILAGTDAAAPNVFPGFSLHEDLEFLVKAGLTPLQAVQAATRNPAQFLLRGDQGTIAVGQRADFVLLDANPLQDIRNTQQIRAVMLNGKLLERRDLDALLDSTARFAATH
jgi:imidazolonepropionase-like amidohydrolase